MSDKLCACCGNRHPCDCPTVQSSQFRRIAALEAVQVTAITMLDDLDNATGPDEWSTSELRAALDAAGKGGAG